MYPVKLINAGYFTLSPKQKSDITRLREVRFYELELIRTEVGISYVDGKAYPHRAGMLLIARPGQRRQTRGSFEAFYLRFACENPLFSEKYLEVLPQVFQLSAAEELEEKYRDLIAAYAEPDDAHLLLTYSRALEIISYLAQMNNQYRGGYTISKSRIDTALMYIRAHYDQPLTLAEMAASAALSPNYFHAVFKAATGLTPAEFLRNTRMSAARRFLLTTDMPLAEISTRCGFENQAYFTKVFRDCCKITPLCFRQNGAKEFW